MAGRRRNQPNGAAIGTEVRSGQSNVDGDATPLFFFERSASMPVRAFTARFAVIDMSAVPTITDFICDSIDGGARTLLSAAFDLGLFLCQSRFFNFQNQNVNAADKSVRPHNHGTNSHAKSLWRCDNKITMTTSAITPIALHEMIRSTASLRKIRKNQATARRTRTHGPNLASSA